MFCPTAGLAAFKAPLAQFRSRFIPQQNRDRPSSGTFLGWVDHGTRQHSRGLQGVSGVYRLLSVGPQTTVAQKRHRPLFPVPIWRPTWWDSEEALATSPSQQPLRWRRRQAGGERSWRWRAGQSAAPSRPHTGPAPRPCVQAWSPLPAGWRALAAGILGPPSQSSPLTPRPRDPRFSQDGGAGLGVTVGDDRARLAFAGTSTHRPSLARAPRLRVAFRRLGRPPSAAAPTCASPLPTRRSRPRAAAPLSALLRGCTRTTSRLTAARRAA